jgi:hypothetical protein
MRERMAAILGVLVSGMLSLTVPMARDVAPEIQGAMKRGPRYCEVGEIDEAARTPERNWATYSVFYAVPIVIESSAV